MHWSAGYIGREYLPGAFDCADLVEAVAREQFGRQVTLPKDRPGDQRSAGYQALLTEHAPRFVERLDLDAAGTPAEGDVVIMIGAGRVNHVGIAAIVAGEGYVLHNFIKAHQVVLHRIRDLASFGLTIEGFYRWI